MDCGRLRGCHWSHTRPPGGDRGTMEGSIKRDIGRETPIRTGMSKSPPGPLCWDSVVDAVICSIAAFCLSRTLEHANGAVWGVGVSRRGRRGGALPRLPDENRGPRPFRASASSVVDRRLGVEALSLRAGGNVDSGFRRNDERGTE